MLRSETGFVNSYTSIFNATIQYLGNTGDVGMYIEIGENLDSSMSEEISEITASLYPYLTVSDFKVVDTPVISTSGGKTYMYIKDLDPEKTYRISFVRQQILKMSDTKDVPSNIQLNAYLYSAERLSELKNAQVKINDKTVSIPITKWMPACAEATLTQDVMNKAISNTLKSGIQYEEILVLNEDLKTIPGTKIDIKGMKDSDGSILITMSPYSTEAEGMLEEFMITAVAKGKSNTTSRSQESEVNMYILHIDLSKAKYDYLAVRVNYAIASTHKNPMKLSESTCNMVRLNIQYIPANKQTQAKECADGSFESNIKSIIPNLLPDSTLTHEEDQLINYEYSTVNNPAAKFKINPFKPEGKL
jgi:hypothetical protein